VEKIDQVREWLEEKQSIIRLEKESLEGISKAELELEIRLLNGQQALLDELAKIVEQ
jgi:hypothetical protein